MNELAAALLLATVGMGLAAWAAHGFAGITNPATLFIGAWTTSLSLFALHLLPFEPLSPTTVTILGASLLSFLAGTLVMRLPGWQVYVHRAGEWYRQRAPATERTATVGILTFLFLCGLLAATLYVRAVWRLEGPWAFFTKLAAVRLLKPELHYPAPLLWGSAMFLWLVAGGVERQMPGRLPRWMLWAMPLAIAPFFITTGRTELFFVTITALVAWLLSQGPNARLRTKHIILLGAAAAMLLVAFLGISFLLGKGRAAVALGFGFPPSLVLLVDPYLYATGPLGSFHHLVGDVTLSGDLAGPLTLWPLHRALFAVGMGPPPSSWVADFVQIPFLFNTFTYLEPYYREYGVVGCLGGSFLVGSLSGWLYQVAVRAHTAEARLPYAIIAFAIVFTPFMNHFSQLVVPMLIAVSIVLVAAGHAMSNLLRSRENA